jgi:predicted Zn-dependent protease
MLVLLGGMAAAIALFVVAGGPLHRDASQPPEVSPPVALPTQPAERSVEELREEAEAAITELMERHPDSPGALHIAATYYAELHQYDKAANLWERCVQLAPSYAGPRAGLAVAAMERGDDARAVTILNQAIAAGCRTPEIVQHLATALQKTGDLKGAEAGAREGVQAFPEEAALWILLGQIQLQQDKLAEAEMSLREGVRRRRDSASAHYALATVLARQGKLDEAADHRRTFAELKSESPLEQHRFQTVYEAALRRVVVTTLCNVASEHERQDDPQEAERLYRNALALAPGSPGAYHWLASFYREQGRLEDAHRVQHRLAQVEPDRLENYLNLASLASQLGRMDEAENALLNAARVAPEAAVVYRSLAGLSLQRGDAGRARAMAEQAARREPSADHYLLLAEACRQAGDSAGAEAALGAARGIAAANPNTEQSASPTSRNSIDGR